MSGEFDAVVSSFVIRALSFPILPLAIGRHLSHNRLRCRESSSIFRASGFYDDSDFLKRCGKYLWHHCFVG
jgi:hypothetical protein